MTHRTPKKIGMLEEDPFGNGTYHLWRCADCQGYFAAAKPTFGVHVVGLIAIDDLYRENRMLNRIRQRWADARERGQVCICAFHAEWPTSDQLHVRLAESPTEGPPWGLPDYETES
jgi:hypothetical protein